MNALRWPLWARCQLVSLIWTFGMYVFVVRGPRTVVLALAYLVISALLGLALWAVLRVQERRLYGDLTEAERGTAVAAVRSGQPPEDPRLAAAAARVAKNWAGKYRNVGFQIGVFGFFFLLFGYLAVTGTLWAWAGLVFWPLVGWHSMRMERRQRDTGRRYLAAAAAV